MATMKSDRVLTNAEWLAAELNDGIAALESEADKVASGERAMYLLGWLLGHSDLSDAEAEAIIQRIEQLERW